ncbi:Protein kinase domain-containing protein [Aphelenchoides bicaudatus]|nr:Protein kinase domain-containing protein [Aphelenchoides bicaudatus]
MIYLRGQEYELHKKIGDGGFGEVFQGIRTCNTRSQDVAIKKCQLVKSRENRPDPKKEAEILQELSKIPDAKHVIAEYYDSFEEDGYYYMVMELCQHGSIYDFLTRTRKKPFTEEQTRDMVLSILTALDIIHSAGYVHRDLSPKNILIYAFTVDSVPQIKLVDFGLSKKTHLIKGTVAGTPGFFDAGMMRDGYSEEVDFYALGCIMFFMLTNELIASKSKALTKSEIENALLSRGLSKDAFELVMFMTDKKNRIKTSNEIKLYPFFTKDYMNAARMQVSSIIKSTHTQERSTFRELQNRPPSSRRERNDNYAQKYEYRNLPRAHAQSLPTKPVYKHPSKLSVATTVSPLPWPFPPEFMHIVKNVMVSNFGRALLRGLDGTFICETLAFSEDSRCTYVGRLLNACTVDQELRIYKPTKSFLLPDFTTYTNGIPESALKLVARVTRPNEFERKEAAAARTMYAKMKSILKAVCEMVRKREENPNMIVDTLAKVTWGGTISVDLPDKQVIRWSYKAKGPPIRDYPNLSEDVQLMLQDVHNDFCRLFCRERMQNSGFRKKQFNFVK